MSKTVKEISDGVVADLSAHATEDDLVVQQLSTSLGENVSLRALNSSLTEERDDLKKRLEEATGGTVTKTLAGVNYGDDPQVDESLYQGRAKVARIFCQGLKVVTWASIPRVQRAMKAGVTTFVVSWKEHDVNNVKRFLASIPDGLTIYACFNHEPENDHGNPGDAAYNAWSTEWKRLWSLQSPVIRAEGFIPTQILMGWTLYPGSKRKMADWTAPKGTVDCFAFDGYVNKFDPADLVAKIVAATKAAGLTHTGIAETGSQVDDPKRTERLKALKVAIATAEKQGVHFDWRVYWNDVDPGFDCRLTKVDADVWFSD